MHFSNARGNLSRIGIVLSRSFDGEYCVNFRGGKEATAYYTESLDDAVETGEHMASSLAMGSQIEGAKHA